MERSATSPFLDSIKQYSAWNRIFLVVGFFVFYLAVCVIFRGTAGSGVLALAALPVMAAGWLFGFSGASLTFLGAIAANTILISAWAGVPIFPNAVFSGGSLTGNFVLLIVGFGAAWLSQLRQTVNTDAHARERSKKDLAESERRYRILFENLPVALGVTDARGRLITL